LGKQLKRNADLGESILNKIIENCPEINPEWLLTGKGEMLKKDTPIIYKEEEKIQEIAKPQGGCCEKENAEVVVLKKEIELLKENNTTLKENSQLKDFKINQLEQENALLKVENRRLKIENGKLKKEINSSNPGTSTTTSKSVVAVSGKINK
jgi:SMC interacting uncharacterized protein involved in chromosome segregation